MQYIQIPYGKGQLTLSVEDSRLAGVLLPAHNTDTTADEHTLVKNALENPIQSPRLCELAKNKKRFLVITSDHTRPVPSAIMLPIYLAEVRSGSLDAEIRILIATGMHRPTTESEMRAKFGDKLVNQETFINHIAADDTALAFKGSLPSGGELWLNNLVDWADLVVAEGFIEPHFFAGFSGGCKSVLPGIASRKTVLYNHNAQFIKSPLATQGSLNGNPIQQDILYAAKQAKLAFILNVLLDVNKRIIAAFAGDPIQAHAAGCAECLVKSRIRRITADIVVTSNGGYPLDQNVYQSVKGMTAAEACVRQDGVIIMCAALGDGSGGENFYQWFKQADKPATVARAIESIPPEDTNMDQWEAQILARVLCKATCIFVTSADNHQLIEDMQMTWAGNLAEAMNMATAIVGRDSTVVVIPDGVGVIIK